MDLIAPLRSFLNKREVSSAAIVLILSLLASFAPGCASGAGGDAGSASTTDSGFDSAGVPQGPGKKNRSNVSGRPAGGPRDPEQADRSKPGAKASASKQVIPPAQLYRRVYERERSRALEEWRRERAGRDFDSSFDYEPGTIRVTRAEDILLPPDSPPLVRNEYVVQLEKDRSDRDLLNELKKAGIECALVGFVPAFRLVQVRVNVYNQNTLRKIRALPSVRFASQHFLNKGDRAPPPRKANSQGKKTGGPAGWHIKEYGIEKVWKKTKGRGVRIAVLDTGMDRDQRAFRGRIRDPYSVVTRSSKFEDEVYKKGGDTLRVIDHGTKVASVAAGRDESSGFLLGVAPEATVVPIQVMGFSVKNGDIYGNDLGIIEGIARAVALRAHVINLSIGTDFSRILTDRVRGDRALYTLALRRIRYRTAVALKLYQEPLDACRKRGIPVVVSAGNDGMSAELEPLATHAYTLAAGAIERTNQQASFSNTGDKVDSFAPGVAVPAAAPGGNVFLVSGTSFSAPYVSGILALAKASGLPVTPERTRPALRSSNKKLRTTILPGPALPVFDPVGFLNRLGGRFARDNRKNRGALLFNRLYGDILIHPNDPAGVRLKKILEYYSRREFYNKDDPEAKAGQRLTLGNFDAMAEYIGDGKLTALNVCSLLADADLSPVHIKYLRERVANSDYLALPLWRKADRAALPAFYLRLKTVQFNGNTLIGVHNLSPVATRKISDYLRLLHSKTKEFQFDEGTAMVTLSERAADRKAARDLIIKSYWRFLEWYAAQGDPGDIVRKLNEVAAAMTNIGRKDGVEIAFQAIRALDILALRLKNSEDDPFVSARLERLEVDYADAQRIINESTEFGVKYDYQQPPKERKRRKAAILKKLGTAVRQGKKFVSPGRAN